MLASAPTRACPLNSCRGRCPRRPESRRRRSHPCRARPAWARVSGQRMVGQRRYESTAVYMSIWCAWQKVFHTGCIPGAEGFQNHGFWRRSLGTFCRCWQKVPRRRHMTRGAAQGELRIATAGVRTGFAMTVFFARGAVQAQGGGVRAPRPTGIFVGQGPCALPGGGA